MRLALYGVSRSGKDYFISEITEYFRLRNQRIYHVKGSNTLSVIAQSEYKKSFGELSDTEKSVVRDAFISTVYELEKEHGCVIVDGHYSFYNEDGTLTCIFNKSDKECYDKFF